MATGKLDFNTQRHEKETKSSTFYLGPSTNTTINVNHLSRHALQFPQPLSFGCFGPDFADLITWVAESTKGRLSTLKECLEAHPLKFV